LIVSDFPQPVEEFHQKRWLLHTEGTIFSHFLQSNNSHERWIDFWELIYQLGVVYVVHAKNPSFPSVESLSAGNPIKASLSI
jgi:hypothetical protein